MEIDIIMICSKCGKEPEINKEMSNENWKVVDNKPCKYCGGELKIKLLSNISPNKENEKRDFIYCLDKNCDGYKGGLWVDKLKQDDTHNAFICPDCCKLIPVVNINVERNLSIKENKNNG